MLQLFCLFAYAFCLAMLLPILLPSLHALFFAPFLVLIFYRRPLLSCLWWSLTCGFIIDLLSSQTRLGIYAVNYCLVTLCLYPYKFHFFEDRLSTLPIMTFCFTCLSILIQTGILYVSGTPFSLSWAWVKTDLFFIPLQNALYAGWAFTFPSWMIFTMKRRFSFFQMIKRRKS